MRMNQEAKALWLARLRDPSAKQTTGQLGKASGERCCLGVLCDIAVEQGIISPPTESPDGLWYGESDRTLPREVQDWSSVGKYGQRGPSDPSLANLNDRGTTFAEIADVIEEEF